MSAASLQTGHQGFNQASILILTIFLLMNSGCQSPSLHHYPITSDPGVRPVELAPGDVIRIAFPGAPDLNVDQKVRSDGMINLPMVGEIRAAGKRPAELQDELIQIFEPHLQLKEVFVSLETPAVPIYVSGAVLRPGKILIERRLTPLEAVMEAGGFDMQRANLRRTVVIRHQGEERVAYRVDLNRALQGQPDGLFFLEANDIIHVPEKAIFY
jgi:polysaccharide biosynthesis/export protein